MQRRTFDGEEAHPLSFLGSQLTYSSTRHAWMQPNTNLHSLTLDGPVAHSEALPLHQACDAAWAGPGLLVFVRQPGPGRLCFTKR